MNFRKIINEILNNLIIHYIGWYNIILQEEKGFHHNINSIFKSYN